MLVGGVKKSKIPESVGQTRWAESSVTSVLYCLHCSLCFRIHLGRVGDGEGDRGALIGEEFSESALGVLAGAVRLIAPSSAVDFEL